MWNSELTGTSDIVLPLIERNRQLFGNQREFVHIDLLRGILPRVELVLFRDCLVHLSFREVRLALQNIKASGARFVATTTFPDHRKNADTVTPYWRALNLQLAPFNLPEPLH